MKRIKYLGINLPKETKDLYIENYKTLVKEIKEYTNRWRNIPCHGLEESIEWKWVYFPKQSTDSVQSLPMVFFRELEQIISQFVWK